MIARRGLPDPAPVALIVYNRPDTTVRVLRALRAAGRRRLVVLADGPAPTRRGDARACRAVRRVVDAVAGVPGLDVTVDAAATNLGLKRRVETGLDAVFAREERAIVLEDDCMPDPTFFRFCDELLARYQDDDRVLSIAGSRPVPAVAAPASYGFSRYPLIWGWATWRRAWRLHDPAMAAWPRLRDEGWPADVLGDAAATAYWSHLFQGNYEAPHTWDYAWTLACWRARGLAVVPARNLVANIGFGAGATHTTDARTPLATLTTEPLAFPLVHPSAVAADADLDASVERRLFSGNLAALVARLRSRLAAPAASP